MKHFALLLVFVALSFTTLAQNFSIEKYHVDLELLENGSLHVTENIDVEFSSKSRGIYRTIPIKHQFGDNAVQLEITDVDVVRKRSKVSTKGGRLEIRIGDPNVFLTGPQSYEFSYTVATPIIKHDNYLELYWNATGDEWKTNIETASLTLKLPSDLALSSDDLRIYTGKRGSTASNATFEPVDNTTIEAKINSPLGPNEGFSIALKMPTEYLALPANHMIVNNNRDGAKGSSGDRPLDHPGFLAIPLLLLAGLWSKWKNLRSKEIVPLYDKEYEYYAPKGLTSAHVGGFIDQSVNTRDIVSLLPYWAAEGFLKMIDSEDDTILIKQQTLPTDFPQYEIELFNTIFKSSARTSLSELKGELSTPIYNAKRQLSAEIADQEYYYEEYKKYFGSWITIVGILALIAIGAVVLATGNSIGLGIGFILLGVALIIMAVFKKPLSPKGKRLIVRLKAFERFLKDSPDQEIAACFDKDPNYFNTIFPFAVAFGIEKQWLQKVAPYTKKAPDWYRGENDVLIPYLIFSERFDTKEMTNTFTYAPQQVSTGGSFGGGGGGFSGGGFGGGGGGSW